MLFPPSIQEVPKYDSVIFSESHNHAGPPEQKHMVLPWFAWLRQASFPNFSSHTAQKTAAATEPWAALKPPPISTGEKMAGWIVSLVYHFQNGSSVTSRSGLVFRNPQCSLQLTVRQPLEALSLIRVITYPRSFTVQVKGLWRKSGCHMPVPSRRWKSGNTQP